MDEKLRSLAEYLSGEYQKLEQYPESSLPYKKALNRLLLYCQRLPKLLKDPHPDYPLAKNKTWQWLIKNIKDFDCPPPPDGLGLTCLPEEALEAFLEQFIHKLTVWINGYLRYRIKDLYCSPSSPAPISLDRVEQKTGTPLVNSFPSPTPSGFEVLERSERQEQVVEMLIYCLTDPQQELKSIHPQDYPQVNCWILSQRLVFKEILAQLPLEFQEQIAPHFALELLLNLPEATYTTLAKEFNIPYQCLNSHWKRKGIPLLKKIADRYSIQNF